MTVTATERNVLADIGRHYGVPARMDARVLFEGRPGTVVGADAAGQRVLVVLDGEAQPDLFHPTWHMTWLDDSRPPTGVPAIPVRPLPSLWTWTPGEAQWSGI